jgi:hypothetical protein
MGRTGVSVQALSWVLEHSAARLGDRLVLISLANHAHEDGSNAYASQGTIAREARLTDRQARRCLKGLEASGEISRTGLTQHGVVIWQLNMPEKSARTNCPRTNRRQPRTNHADRVHEMSDKPSVNRLNRGDSPDYDKLVIG